MQTAQTAQTSLINRHDTFFGVCEGIAQDFGFNSNYLRLALGIGLLLSPMVALGVYFGMGLVVAVSRFAFPQRRVVKAAPIAQSVPTATVREADNDAGRAALATAA